MFPFHELSDDLVTVCVPRGHRVLFSRASKALRTRFARLRLPVLLRVMIRNQDLPARLAHMSHMFRIESLDFSRVNLTVGLLQAFATRKRMDWSNLHTLMLGGDNMTSGVLIAEYRGPDVAAWLRRCSALTTTDALRRTHLHPDVWAAVRDCKSLDLDRLCRYTIKTNDLYKMAENLTNCTRLTALNLSENDIYHLPDIMRPALQSNSSLTLLNLGSNPTVPANIAVYITSWRQSRNTLQKLSLRNLAFDNEMFLTLGKELDQCPNLQVLNLALTRMKPDGLEAFVAGLASGHGLPSLTNFRVGGNKLNDRAALPSMAEFMTMCPQLTGLEMQVNTLHPDMLLADWLTRLEHLNVAQNHLLHDQTWHCLRGFGGGRLQVLRHLDMSYNMFDDTHVGLLAAGLRECRVLRSVRLANCMCKGQDGTDDGLRALMRALNQCSRLTELDLSINALGTALAHGGCFGGSLRMLKLNRTQLNNENLQYVAQIIDGCTALEELDLGFNAFNGKGLSAMVQALSLPCSVRVLRLTNNQIHNAGVVGLVQAQVLWPKLIELEIDRCNIEDSGAKIFAQAASGWPCLQRVDFEYNWIHDDSACMLVEACQRGKWTVRLQGLLSKEARRKLAKKEGCEI